ncbi:MAG: hypothetical protein JWP94_510 [Mucilaginibacter sp.]|nr:hypothetical protein [Mucilaginibacter sp.]
MSLKLLFNFMSDITYLSKRIVLRAIKRGSKDIAGETMQLMGYNVVVHDGWVVKKYSDGRFERIEPVEAAEHEGTLALD